MPLHKPSMGVARPELWAPARYYDELLLELLMLTLYSQE